MRRLLLLSVLVCSALAEENNGTDVDVKDSLVNDVLEMTTIDNKMEEAEIKKNEEVKNELDRAVQNLNASQTTTKGAGPVGLSIPGVQSCTALECNNRGTCIGSKAAFICACQLGFTGRTCEETMCESVRDCNGRGICIGTSATVTCLCQLGFGGPRCETSF